MTIERNIYITECYQPLRDDKYYYTLMYPAVFAAGSFLLGQLICWCSVSVDLIVSNRIAVLAAAIAGVALDGVDTAILHFLHDANMIGRTVLTSIIPIEKDNVAGSRLIAVVHVLASGRRAVFDLVFFGNDRAMIAFVASLPGPSLSRCR